jgi:PPOX class probable FMN-dependent enzyme
MDTAADPHRITDVAALERIYGFPAGAAVEKELDYLHPHYKLLISKSPFVVLATGGPGGLDTSPRGDAPGFIAVEDDKTLLLPDRKGNNRIDSLRNIVADPRVALIFLIPGVGETLRVNGRASITTAPDVLERFRVEGALPRSVIVVKVEAVFFQCSRALWRSKLWDPATQIERASLPSLGTMVQDISNSKIKAADYDNNLYPRLKSTLY